MRKTLKNLFSNNKKSRYTDLIKTVVIIAMVVNVLMFVVNAMQVKAAHVDLDAD